MSLDVGTIDDFMRKTTSHLASEVGQKVSKKSWVQTLSGKGERATLNQEFNLRLANYTVGYSAGIGDGKPKYLIGVNDSNKVFRFEVGSSTNEYIANARVAWEEAISYIKYHL